MYRRTAFYFVGRFALPGLWGAAALVYFSQPGRSLPDSLQATPAYLGILLPTGFIGLLLAAALAAEMSTDSGYLLTWATVIYNDLITPCLKKPLAPAARLLLTRSLVLAIGVFLLFYGLWYKMPGNAWDYLAVTGTIYLASVFTLLVAALYWPRANSTGAYSALVLGAIGPITFLIVNAIIANSSGSFLAREIGSIPFLVVIDAGSKVAQIRPELAGASSFALAFLGMIAGSLLTPAPTKTNYPKSEAAL
jgi:SSS family solute:Na+ symporter